MTRTSSARDRILQAFENLLLSDGERAATLESVAAAAGVSKGGLLYHFGSKEALGEGLIEKFLQLGAEDLVAIKNAPEGAASYYLRTSGQSDASFDKVLIAALRLPQGQMEDAKAAFAELQKGWFDAIQAEINDLEVAQAIMLMGDGMYYNASLHGSYLGIPGTTYEQNLAALQNVVNRLRK
ncbi:predicted transcriptional regulator, TetR family [Renibacterium salmoninarum ATCC 33209]|uniref:Predicted transcriptional regulator, TetR family n=1 Tax=Renibacterium salmoninarum (strain ATCC 33209 / DSM 20767 / JCM 11484 / NBRC 15589 / NCIMB 2235) TaxID=288705 RepID=A9WNF3_RENSM|nr:TetR/AcrR family transcriptional regulator [Renibacterium salmoninarum]ABY22680.1 predicted transcriptional regulator, TetR family [Renibacterium salmoninarum ATCC 33209]